MGFFMD